MKYHCLQKQQWTHNAYRIVPLREEDIYLIRDWRNEQMEVLRQNQLLTVEDQVRYYLHTVKPTFESLQPSIILFSYLANGQCIGYGGLTNIDWFSRRAEISFLVDTARTLNVAQYKEDFTAFLYLMKQVTMEDLHFNRLFTETFDRRSKHIVILEENGFCLEGTMREHVWIDGHFVDSLIHGYIKEYWDAGK